MTQQLQAAITASLAEVADRVTALETTARKNVIVAPDFTKLPLGPLGIILGFVVDEIGKTREGICAEEIILLDRMVGAVHSVEARLNRPFAAGVHQQITEFITLVVVQTIILPTASIE